MPVPIRTLKVRPNPWTHIDSRGLPCGVVSYEQPHGSFDARLVGAARTNVRKIQDAPAGDHLGQAVHVFEVEYSKEDVLVPNTSYYRRRIMRGELIAADKDTYVAAGGSAKGFEEQGKLLEQIKIDAIKAFNAENGEDAFKTLEAFRKEAAEEADKVARAAAADQEPRVLSEAELKRLADAQKPTAPTKAETKTDAKKGDAQ